MRISYNWLKQYLPIDLPVEEVGEILTSLGLEVSNIEHIESVRGGLHGVVAGKVMACQKHPNADRLSLTKVDIGTGDLLQIVCGAPNVAAGQTVWVAQAGTTLYPSGSEKPLTIAKAKVRGEFSEGMICAEDELGLGDDHSGIVLLPEEVQKGTSATQYYDVTSDDVIDIELTPNRSDAISHLGVARDLAAWLSVNKDGVTLLLPEVAKTLNKTADFPIDIEVRSHEGCPRYCGITISGISIGPSPKWMQDRLRAINVKPINNVVDITNFILHEMGQPLHAFDADKISQKKVIVQTLAEGTSFVTLDDVERTLSASDLMICDGTTKGMCIAGVYGGIGTGISENTTSVFLESAHFNPLWIRRTSMRHDLRTEAAKTFEKSTDPNICREALLRAAAFILKYAGGHVASEIIDIYPAPAAPKHVPVRWEMISRLTGAPLAREQVLRIFDALDMQVISNTKETITVAVPTAKADVTREADVIEELLRIYGYDNVPLRPRMEIALTFSPENTLNMLREDLGNFLAANGFLETMGMSLIESRNYEDGPLQIDGDDRVLIANTSNVHLDLMRHSMLPTTMETVRFNQNRMQPDLMLYEFGRTYQRENDGILETEHLTLSITGSPVRQGWNTRNSEAGFFFLKKYVYLVLEHLGIVPDDMHQETGGIWDYGMTSFHGGTPIVRFGKVSSALCRKHDLKADLFFADFNMKSLLEMSVGSGLQISDIPKYPAMRRDIAVVIPKNVGYHQVDEIILRTGGQLLINCNLFDVYENAEALGADKKSLAIALEFQDPSRTLTDEAINKVMHGIVSALEKEVGAMLR